MKILTSILLLFIIIYKPGTSFSQANEELIETIKDEIEDIHLDTTLRIITLKNEEFMHNMTDGGGELTGFYNDKGICKIYKSIGKSYGVQITEFYYKKKKLIFIREKFNEYVYDEEAGSFDYTKLNITYRGSYYFNKEKLIESIVKGSRNFEVSSPDIRYILKTESADAVKLINKSIREIPDREK